MIRALNKLTGLGMPETHYVAWYLNNDESFVRWLDLGNKAYSFLKEKQAIKAADYSPIGDIVYENSNSVEGCQL